MKEPRGRSRHKLVNNITMDFQEKYAGRGPD